MSSTRIGGVTHALTHLEGLSGRRREGERETTRGEKKNHCRGGRGYLEKKDREGEKREWEKKREMSTLVYLEATSGRRRPRATHGGNPYTRVRPRRQLHACTHTHTLYTHIRRGSRAPLSHSYGGDREHAYEKEREAR